jgi:hypothetical protein
MATLTTSISATQNVIAVSDPGTPAAGSLHRVDDEVIAFRGLVLEAAGSWHVSRAAHGTTAATHLAEATVTAVSLVTALDEPD